MIRTLINSERPVTLVGAAPVARETLDLALGHAPHLIAADGGADRARDLQQSPSAIIGDLDSLDSREYWQDSGIQIYHISEQESTDFEKCLSSIVAPMVLAVGFTGGRLDHELAVFSALLAFSDRPVIVIGREDICFHCPPRLVIELAEHTRVSLFPLRPVTAQVSHGLHWPVTGLCLAPGVRVGTSNRATGGRVEVAFDGPGVLVLLPVACLAAVIAALSTTER